MKITAEGLLGSANRINSQRGATADKEKSSIGAKSDRADIVSRVDSRLSTLQSDMKDAQTDLSKNQSIKEGMSRIIEEFNKGGNLKSVLNDVKFNDKKVLLDYLGENGDELTMNVLEDKNKDIDSLIMRDTNKLAKLQVESENIFASNLAKGSKNESVFEKISEMIQSSGSKQSAEISNLNPDAVMRLIR